MEDIDNKIMEEQVEKSEDLQLAENESIDENELDDTFSSEKKRELLKQTKIVKQTWSIQEIYQKIKGKRLDLSPEYQRNEIWKGDKQTAFIESLFMGIIVPPIYVVEIPGTNILDDSIYEVVDGKQRLTAINEFLTNKLRLETKYLEYYADWFGRKFFNDVREEYASMASELLSSVLDIYVITANSPEFTKYDIFSRLNKGAEKLKVNEIRKAIYRSSVLDIIDEFVKSYIENAEKSKVYKELFTKNDIKRYEDYGRFYTSIAFYIKSDVNTCIVKEYNSRPREMINSVLQEAQNNPLMIDRVTVEKILDVTIKLKTYFKGISGADYLINACIPFSVDNCQKLMDSLDIIKSDRVILSTLEKSASTTANVNKRLERIKEIISNG
ncbi:DUF262 domain-containing protein [Alloprevotella tannerae]|uniref:DUF262 domain-containing protein n=1 Tax=Alloprevotella tannerae TaxID=76122 RepID=UPI0028D7302F|nr:DUF262 domain-containing protein [Alloprevotella tannerae]